MRLDYNNVSLCPSTHTIYFLRILLLMGVVLIHCRFTTFVPSENFGAKLINVVSGDLMSICVPCFYFLSGLLFFNKIEGNIVPKLRRRVYSLIIPYLVWNVIGFLLFLVKKMAFAAQFPQYDAAEITFLNFIKGFWSYDLIGVQDTPYPYDFVLWFVRNLILATLISVPIYKAFGVKKWLLLVLLAVAIKLSAIDKYGIAMALFYFYAGGVFLHLTKKGDESRALTVKNLSFFVCLCLAIWIPWCCELFSWLNLPNLWLVFTLIGILGIVGAVELVVSYFNIKFQPSNPYLRSLFCVYAAHGLWATVANNFVIGLVHPISSTTYLIAYCLLFLLLWYVNMTAFLLIEKISPHCAAVLTGFRA